MDKPTFPKIIRFTPGEIRAIRAGFRMTQANFARFFPVSMDTIRSWENGRSNPYGPSGPRLQELKAYVDHITAPRSAAISKALARLPS